MRSAMALIDDFFDDDRGERLRFCLGAGIFAACRCRCDGGLCDCPPRGGSHCGLFVQQFLYFGVISHAYLPRSPSNTSENDGW